MSQTILFDIDRTLLNTDEFVAKTNNLIMQKLGISLDQINQIEEIYNKSIVDDYHFSFVDFLKALNPTQEQLSFLIHQYKTNTNLYPKYSEVIPSLTYLYNKGYKLGIFSEGVPDFQYNKLKNLQIEEFIQPDLVFISQYKRIPEFLQIIPSNVYIVDDNPNVIEILVSEKRFTTIHINRSGKLPKISPDIKVKSLLELKQYL